MVPINPLAHGLQDIILIDIFFSYLYKIIFLYNIFLIYTFRSLFLHFYLVYFIILFYFFYIFIHLKLENWLSELPLRHKTIV